MSKVFIVRITGFFGKMEYEVVAETLQKAKEMVYHAQKNFFENHGWKLEKVICGLYYGVWAYEKEDDKGLRAHKTVQWVVRDVL